MAKFKPEILDPTLAPVVPLHSARERRIHAGVSHLTRDAAHTEARLFRGALIDLYGDHEAMELAVGDPILFSIATSDVIPLARITEEKVGTNARMTVVVSPDEYEWLSTNLYFSAWNKTENGATPEKLLGRYYRLLLAIDYIVARRGSVALDHVAFQDALIVGSHVVDLSTDRPNVSEARRDTAQLRFAGSMALRAMALSDRDENRIREYLNLSITDRIDYALQALKFTEDHLDIGATLPPDLDKDFQHWLGVCLPLHDADLRPQEIWIPE